LPRLPGRGLPVTPGGAVAPAVRVVRPGPAVRRLPGASGPG